PRRWLSLRLIHAPPPRLVRKRIEDSGLTTEVKGRIDDHQGSGRRQDVGSASEPSAPDPRSFGDSVVRSLISQEMKGLDPIGPELRQDAGMLGSAAFE